MGKMFDNDSMSLLGEAMQKELAKVEFELEDGSTVSNIEGICQGLISRALDGDLQALNLIAELTEGKR